MNDETCRWPARRRMGCRAVLLSYPEASFARASPAPPPPPPFVLDRGRTGPAVRWRAWSTRAGLTDAWLIIFKVATEPGLEPATPRLSRRTAETNRSDRGLGPGH